MGLDEASSPGIHVCLLIHGLWGNPTHLDHVARTLREQFSDEILYVLQAENNTGNFTYDGIEVGAERVTKELEEQIERLAKDGKTVKKLSIVGYSLGGLVARYVIGLLYSKGWLDKLEPVNFTTFATPHLGARAAATGWPTKVWNAFGGYTLSASGRQLFLFDTFRDTGRPLLAILADPNSTFIRGLSAFKRRSLYANIINDRTVPYYTAYISRTDPYVDLDSIDIHYLPGTGKVLLDPEKPTALRSEQLSTYKTIAEASQNILSKTPMFLLLSVAIPIGSVAYLTNSVIQSFTSAQRIKLHEEGRAGIGIGTYRLPLMIESIQRHAEDAFEEVNASQPEEYLTRQQSAMEQAVPNSTTASSSSSSSSSSTDDTSAAKEEAPARPSEVAKDKHGFPILALTHDQFKMIESLDALRFTKHAVHFQNVRHSHAAIVRRMAASRFDEGKIVVKHWAENFEL